MLGAITLLLCCQLAGEIIRVLSGVPIPGPVIGMVLLFIGLLIRRRFFSSGDKPEIPAALDETVRGLLGHLSLLFVPAGVGVMLYLPLIAEEWLAISAALIGSTVITIAVTALIMSWLGRFAGGSGGGVGEKADET